MPNYTEQQIRNLASKCNICCPSPNDAWTQLLSELNRIAPDSIDCLMFDFLQQNDKSVLDDLGTVLDLADSRDTAVQLAARALRLFKKKSSRERTYIIDVIKAVYHYDLSQEWQVKIFTKYQNIEQYLDLLNNEPRLTGVNLLLAIAIYFDDTDLMHRLLTEHEADPNCPVTHYIKSHLLFYCHSWDSIQCLLENGASVAPLLIYPGLVELEYRALQFRLPWRDASEERVWHDYLTDVMMAEMVDEMKLSVVNKMLYRVHDVRRTKIPAMLKLSTLMLQKMLRRGVKLDDDEFFKQVRALIIASFDSQSSVKPYTAEILVLCDCIVDAIESSDRNPSDIERRVALTCASILGPQASVRASRLSCDALEEQISLRSEACHEFHRVSSEGEDANDIAPWKRYLPKKVCDFFMSVYHLLLDTEHCVDLLQGLEEQLSITLGESDCDLSVFSQATSHIQVDLIWPIFELDSVPQTHSLLHRLLLDKERRHGLNVAPNAPIIFSGFVDSDVANGFVRDGHLYTEYLFNGDPLHGKYSHRLQWHIILSAIEQGQLVLPEDYTLRELFALSPNCWSDCFDRYPYDGAKTIGFTAPHAMHSSLLLLQGVLPCLSLYLRKVYHSGLVKVLKKCRETSFNIELLVLKHTVIGNIFLSPFDGPSPKDHYSELRTMRQGDGYMVFFKGRDEQGLSTDAVVRDASGSASAGHARRLIN